MSDHTTSTNAAAAVWLRAVTLAELCADLIAFSGWGSVVRAHRAPELAEVVKAVLANERSTARGTAKTSVMDVTALVAELGVTRRKVYDALGQATTTRPAPAAAVVDVSEYRLLLDGADQAWLMLAG